MTLLRRLALAGLLLAAGAAQAASLRFCEPGVPMTAQQQDRLLRFAAVVRRELEASGAEVALIARSGLDLSRWGLRYSHAGFSLKGSANTPWSVRQLYYACDEQRPRLYDEGLAGFLLGTDDPSIGYVSIVLLPREVGAAALDNARSLRLLAARYSATAHPYSLRYQNCNQWVAELLASAWGGLADGDELRARAQRWLVEHDYLPPPIELHTRIPLWVAGQVQWLPLDDHPAEDLAQRRLRISLPEGIEAWVHARLPQAQRIELCHDERKVVVRRGWDPLPPGCRAEAGDEVIALD